MTGYDGNGKAILVKSTDFRIFLILDTLSFGFSAATLLIYFGMPIIRKMTFVQKYIAVQAVAMWLSMISLFFMVCAFVEGIAAVLDEKSSLSYYWFHYKFWLVFPHIPVCDYLL